MISRYVSSLSALITGMDWPRRVLRVCSASVRVRSALWMASSASCRDALTVVSRSSVTACWRRADSSAALDVLVAFDRESSSCCCSLIKLCVACRDSFAYRNTPALNTSIYVSLRKWHIKMGIIGMLLSSLDYHSALPMVSSARRHHEVLSLPQAFTGFLLGERPGRITTQ